MSGIEYGFKRAVAEILGGFVTSAILDAFFSTGLIPLEYVLLFHLVNVLSTVGLAFAMPYWATTTYSIGWLIGLALMYSSGLVGILEVLVYLIPLGIVVIRLIKSA